MKNYKTKITSLSVATLGIIALGGFTYAAQSNSSSLSSNTSQSPSSMQNTMKDKIEGRKMMKKDGMMNHGMGRMGKEGKFANRDENSPRGIAIKNNDYDAFVAALKADTQRPSTAPIPTKEQFEKMVAQYQKKVAKQKAIESNDYDAFVKATTPTKEEFAEIVAIQKSRQSREAAIKNNDYDAFVAALKADPLRPTDAPIPTKEQFAKMIERKSHKKSMGDLPSPSISQQ